MNTSLEMLIQLFERAALLLICLFFMIRIPRFKESLQKKRHSPTERVVITLVFCIFAIFGTYSGINVEGSLVNVRIIAVVSGGILFGPWVGIITGIVSGVHRYLIDIGGITSIPCLITSILAGVISGYINRRVKRSLRWIYGIAAGIVSEILTMLLILAMADPFELGLDIVAIFNTSGRIILGALSDKVGRLRVVSGALLVTAAAVTVLSFVQLNYGLFFTCVAGIAFCFGGNITIFPAIVADFFGLKNQSKNYGIIYQGFDIGAISGSFIASALGGFLPTFKLIAVLSIVSLFIALTIKAPDFGAPKAKKKRTRGEIRNLSPEKQAS